MFVTKQINTLKNIILMKTKPFLSFWQIWNLTFGFLGIQFGFALQNANSSRILQTYGADVEQLSLFWLLVQAKVHVLTDKLLVKLTECHIVSSITLLDEQCQCQASVLVVWKRAFLVVDADS